MLFSVGWGNVFSHTAGAQWKYRGYYTAARRYDFYRRVVKRRYDFQHEKIKVISSSHRVMFYLLYSPKQKIVKFNAQKQIGKSHVIDIFTSEDMENISLCIFQYLTLYYIIKDVIGCRRLDEHIFPTPTPFFIKKN